MKTICVDDAVSFLNAALKCDPEAMKNLIDARVTCNAVLANHPTIQVLEVENGGTEVGLLGILNGLFGVDYAGRGYIQAVYDGAECIKEFITTRGIQY